VDHSWPGNVCELRNVVERALIVCCTSQIVPKDLGLEPDLAEHVVPLARESSAGRSRSGEHLVHSKQELVASLERESILAALSANGGSTTRAAAQLGMSRSTLWLKMKKYGIARPSHV
jgi:sigma-54 dependent transcriptional regulator, acetoin dehydrogenase operon transcriptional activator AcoR